MNRFALIPLPENGEPPPDAIAVGPMSAVAEPILSSKARDDAAELLNFTRDSVAELQRLAGGLAEQKAEYVFQVISGLCDGIARMTTRLDAYVKRENERQRLVAEEASRTELHMALDALPEVLDGPCNEIDDEEPHGELPAPPLEPPLRESDDSPE
jgi:hypothetical protein